jgi:methylthioribose-1-phosphate isomerase
VRYARGKSKATGRPDEVLICPEESGARNWGFDVTPRRLITGLITERGICEANREGIESLFPKEEPS